MGLACQATLRVGEGAPSGAPSGVPSGVPSGERRQTCTMQPLLCQGPRAAVRRRVSIAGLSKVCEVCAGRKRVCVRRRCPVGGLFDLFSLRLRFCVAEK